MKIEKRKYRTLYTGDVVKVHSYKYVKGLLENAKLKNCNIQIHIKMLYGKEYTVVSSRPIENKRNIINAFPLATFMYKLKSDSGTHSFYEFEIINCR